MELIRKEKILDSVFYTWVFPEVKTEEDCFRLIYEIASIGDVWGINFRGYGDMDIHENEVSFRSIKNMKDGLEEIDKVEPDSVDIRMRVGEENVCVSISPFGGSEDGVRVSMFDPEEAANYVAGEIEKIGK